MKEYLEKSVVLDNVLNQMQCSKSLLAMQERIQNLESADVVEQKHGRWVLVKDWSTEIIEDGEKYWVCSLCGCGSDSYDTTYHTKFCPQCGARMDGET